MIVELKEGFVAPDEHDYRLSMGTMYRVLGIEADYYRIVDDTGEPCLFPPDIFSIVDATEPGDWKDSVGDDGERYAYPPELGIPGFFEDYFDGAKHAIETLRRYL